jgi:hypothetical protein
LFSVVEGKVVLVLKVAELATVREQAVETEVQPETVGLPSESV